MLRVMLIGGSSHVGKSTLAASLASTLGWPAASTDRLGRHPGRPWPSVPEHVAEHYLKLSPAAVYQFLLVHHENLWPRIAELISRHGGDPAAGPLVLEGSALRPELVAAVLDAGTATVVQAVWLVATPDLIRRRIVGDSGFATASARSRRMIEAFVGRSLTDNEQIAEQVRRLGLHWLDAANRDDLTTFAAAAVRDAGGGGNG